MSLPETRGELPEENMAQLEDEQLADEIAECLRESELWRARAIRRLDEMDQRRSYANEGFLSATSWLRGRCQLTARAAKSLVSAARSLRSMPKTKRAYESGAIHLPAVQMLGIAAEAHPETFAQHEGLLVEQAKRLSPSGLRKTLDYWRQAADGDDFAKAAARQHSRRKLFLSSTIDGMVRIDGDLDPEAGQIVVTAIRSLSDSGAIDPTDERTSPQRRADALVELCQQHLKGGSDNAGTSAQLSVIVDLQTLAGVSNSPSGGASAGVSEFEDGTVIDAQTARRIACDAGVSRVIVNGKSGPLDVGRRTPTVPAAMRRGLIVRDRHCTYDGCDRPSQWCEAHHIVPWSMGGDTALTNLRLLCRRHHRMVHDAGGHDP